MPNLEKVKHENNLKNIELHQNFEYLLSDMLLHTPEVSHFINEKMVQDSRIRIETKRVKDAKTQDFEHYHKFNYSIKHLKSHQVLAINRYLCINNTCGVGKLVMYIRN